MFLVTLVAEVFEIFDVLFGQVDAVNLVRLGVEFSWSKNECFTMNGFAKLPMNYPS